MPVPALSATPVTVLLDAASRAAGEPLRLVPVVAGREGSGVLLARGSTRIAHLAVSAGGRARLRRDAALHGWACGAGVPLPERVAADRDGAWTLSALVRDDPLDVRGAEAVVAAVARLAAAGPPPEQDGASSWRAPLRGRARRARRAVVGRLPIAEFRAARAAAAALPAVVPAHGDLQDGNVLWDAAAGRVHLVDWEYAGLHPAGWDLMSLWVHVGPAEQQVLREGVRAAGVPQEQVAVLAHWLALRHLADLLTGAGRRARDPRAVDHARAVLRQARALRG